MLAERYATVRNGKIAAINTATPPREIKLNQFELTLEEYRLIDAISPRGEDVITSIRNSTAHIQQKLAETTAKILAKYDDGLDTSIIGK
jgi:hypothetical protein